MDRRSFIEKGTKSVIALGLGTIGGMTLSRSAGREMVWQIDPEKCSLCGKCAELCVLKPSAVKCVINHQNCSFREDCDGYFKPRTKVFSDLAENRQCPTGALKRRKVEGGAYEYTVDESLCIGCGKCGRMCRRKGRGAMVLQINQKRCAHCNECGIEKGCPKGAITRIPAKTGYLDI